jgi:hypothetical protein
MTEAAPPGDDDRAGDPPPLEGEGTGPADARRAALILAVSVAVLLAVASIALAVVANHRQDRLSRVDSLRKAAGAAGSALLSYDYHDPTGNREAVLKLSTGSFRKEYEQTFDQGLGQLIAKVKATAVGTVKDVYVSSIDSNGAQAIVVADVTTKGPSGSHTLYDQYVLLSFVDAKGTWKVDDVTDLNFAQASALSGGTTPGSGASSSTTSSTTPVP